MMKFLSILYTILEFIGNSQSLLTKQHQILRNQDPPSRILDRETKPVMKILKCASWATNIIFYCTNASRSSWSRQAKTSLLPIGMQYTQNCGGRNSEPFLDNLSVKSIAFLWCSLTKIITAQRILASYGLIFCYRRFLWRAAQNCIAK